MNAICHVVQYAILSQPIVQNICKIIFDAKNAAIQPGCCKTTHQDRTINIKQFFQCEEVCVISIQR